jgi:hypothetical protein
LPDHDEGLTHEYDGNISLDEHKACLDDYGNQFCGPRRARVKQQEPRREFSKELSKEGSTMTNTASLASSEYLPSNLFLHHVRYEIGEHPLADILTLTGGGETGSPVLVGMLVPGGKAEQAGIASGDELVAVSGRSDFQRIPAERLLESLPTPTLLVFAKDPKKEPKLNPNQAERSVSRGNLRKETSMPILSHPGHPGEFSFSEASGRNTPGWFGAATESTDRSGISRGGAAWDSQVTPDPVLAERTSGGGLESGTWSKAVFAMKAAGIGRYNTEPQPTLQREIEKEPPPKPPAQQVAIIQRDDMNAGVPMSHSLFGPNVQVELCDQVVFNPTATLWMEGTTNSAAASPVWPPGSMSASGSAEPESRLGDTRHGSSTWMYELPRQEARRLVEKAKRAASRADQTGSRPEEREFSGIGSYRGDFRLDDREMSNFIGYSDKDALALSREAKTSLMTEGEPQYRLARFGIRPPMDQHMATQQSSPSLMLDGGGYSRGGNAQLDEGDSCYVKGSQMSRFLVSASIASSKASPLDDTNSAAAPAFMPQENGPRLGPTGARAAAPIQVDPQDVGDTICREASDTREDSSTEKLSITTSQILSPSELIV